MRFAEARGVVLERQVVLVVDAEAAQAVGIGEFAEVAELVLGEGRLQFVDDFDESHGGHYSREFKRGLRAGERGT